MSFFQVDTTGAEQAYGEFQEGGNGKFPPLPGGRYQANVVPLKKDGSQLVEVVDFSKKTEYAGKKALRVALRILDGSPTGAKRTFFARIPLFTMFPSGKSARAYFGFFGGLGVTPEQLKAGQIPGPDEFLGKQITITLSEPIEPDNYNELGSNDVSWFDAPEATFAATPLRQPGVPVAAWLDADDNLIAGFENPAATGTPQTSWSTGGGFGAPQAQAPAAGNPWGGAPAQAADGGSPWGNPQGDSALAAAATGAQNSF